VLSRQQAAAVLFSGRTVQEHGDCDLISSATLGSSHVCDV